MEDLIKKLLEDDSIPQPTMEELQREFEEEKQKPHKKRDLDLMEEIAVSMFELQARTAKQNVWELEQRYDAELQKPFKQQDLDLLGELAEQIMHLKGIKLNPMPFEEIQRIANARKTVRRKKFFKTSRIAAACVGALFIVTATAAAMGYNVLDMIRTALGMPEKTISDYNNGNDNLIRSDDTRFYDSFEEMLKNENLNIFYPTELPTGYEFTDFRVSDYGDYSELKAYSLEPYIVFEIEFDVTHQIESYEYETNGIYYNIVEPEMGRYQAEWNVGADFYRVIVGNKADLSKIIKNLQEW